MVDLPSDWCIHIGLPTALDSPSAPGKITTDPDGGKAAIREYFADLYNHPAPPDMAKPRISSKSIQEIKQNVQADPFQWPQRASLEDFRAMLNFLSAIQEEQSQNWYDERSSNDLKAYSETEYRVRCPAPENLRCQKRLIKADP